MLFKSRTFLASRLVTFLAMWPPSLHHYSIDVQSPSRVLSTMATVRTKHPSAPFGLPDIVQHSSWISRLHTFHVCICSLLFSRYSDLLDSSLKIYGASDKRRELEPALIWATPGQRGFPPSRASSSTSATVNGRTGSVAPVMGYSAPIPSRSAPFPSSSQSSSVQTAVQKEAIRKQQESLHKAAELRQMLNNLEKVDDESRRTSLLDTLCSTEDVLNMPLHQNPPGRASGELTVDLLKHQVSRTCIFIPLELMVFFSASSLAMVH